jgi:hypothetical protein
MCRSNYGSTSLSQKRGKKRIAEEISNEFEESRVRHNAREYLLADSFRAAWWATLSHEVVGQLNRSDLLRETVLIRQSTMPIEWLGLNKSKKFVRRHDPLWLKDPRSEVNCRRDGAPRSRSLLTLVAHVSLSVLLDLVALCNDSTYLGAYGFATQTLLVEAKKESQIGNRRPRSCSRDGFKPSQLPSTVSE